MTRNGNTKLIDFSETVFAQILPKVLPRFEKTSRKTIYILKAWSGGFNFFLVPLANQTKGPALGWRGFQATHGPPMMQGPAAAGFHHGPRCCGPIMVEGGVPFQKFEKRPDFPHLKVWWLHTRFFWIRIVFVGLLGLFFVFSQRTVFFCMLDIPDSVGSTWCCQESIWTSAVFTLNNMIFGDFSRSHLRWFDPFSRKTFEPPHSFTITGTSWPCPDLPRRRASKKWGHPRVGKEGSWDNTLTFWTVDAFLFWHFEVTWVNHANEKWKWKNWWRDLLDLKDGTGSWKMEVCLEKS